MTDFFDQDERLFLALEEEGGGVVAVTGIPANAYVTESGLNAYTAEDGVSIYITET